jgi:hypothetical protein
VEVEVVDFQAAFKKTEPADAIARAARKTEKGFPSE